MVGSVLLERMQAEKDFDGYEPLFASTSQAGEAGPSIGLDLPPLVDAYDVEQLKTQDIIVTCQGSDYTRMVYPELRKSGWSGYWLDAASALRMENSSIIVLDPVNRSVINNGLSAGIKDYIGGNCTVSLMLMGLAGLFEEGLVEWMTTMTYQAASGAGAKNMRELVAQMRKLGSVPAGLVDDPSSSILELDRSVTNEMNKKSFPSTNFGAPLAGSALPWIDSPVEGGQSREEWKGIVETNKILGNATPIPVDGLCVRIGAMRCHAQALTIKLTRDLPVDKIEEVIDGANEWVKVVPNTREETIDQLTPTQVAGTLNVPVGRIHKMNMGPEYLALYTVGDQLLWGAAEPIRRMLQILLQHLS
jgi:aspartate-semialdehyde dehydrogenase